MKVARSSVVQRRYGCWQWDGYWPSRFNMKCKKLPNWISISHHMWKRIAATVTKFDTQNDLEAPWYGADFWSKGQRSRLYGSKVSEWVSVYSYSITALQWHSLDGAIIFYWQRAVILMKNLALFTYFLIYWRCCSLAWIYQSPTALSTRRRILC